MKKFMFCLFLLSLVNCSFAGKNFSKFLPNNNESENSEKDVELGSFDTSIVYSDTSGENQLYSSEDDSSSEDTEKLLKDLEVRRCSVKNCGRVYKKHSKKLTSLIPIAFSFLFLSFAIYTLKLAVDERQERREYGHDACIRYYEGEIDGYDKLCLEQREALEIEYNTLFFFVCASGCTILSVLFCID